MLVHHISMAALVESADNVIFNSLSNADDEPRNLYVEMTVALIFLSEVRKLIIGVTLC